MLALGGFERHALISVHQRYKVHLLRCILDQQRTIRVAE